MIPGQFTQKTWDKYERRRNQKYPRPKWLEFAAIMLSYQNQGVSLKLYDARSTVSKYLYVTRNGKTVKIRFSNHQPANGKIMANDSDYYVGVSQLGVIQTEQVIPKVLQDLGLTTVLHSAGG